MNAPPASLPRWMRGGAGACLIGSVALVGGALLEPRQALFSYLVAWAFGFTIAMGALAFSMTSYITHARWMVALQRLIEAVTATLPFFALAFLPIALFAPHLYLWAAAASSWSPHVAEQVHAKQAYLNLPFWYGRALFCFAFWSAIALLLRRWSIQADQSGDPALTDRRRALSAAAAPAVALSFTFAVFDWMMSLDPTWTSNAYGFYVFGGAFLSACSLLALLAFLARRAGWIPAEVGAGHFHALGNVMLAMTVFWTYIAFVQMMLIWSANLPEEVSWYVTRSHGSWAGVCWYLGVAHFALPFFALLVRQCKRDPRRLAAIGGWLLVAHWVDLHWLIMPTLHPEGLSLHWLDLAALLSLGGASVWLLAWRFASAARVPQRDPAFNDSLRFEMR